MKNFKNYLLLIFYLFTLSLYSCSSNPDVEVYYVIQVKANDNLLGETYINTEGTTDVKVKEGDSVTIYAIAKEEASFENWTYIENGETKSIENPEYIVNNINSDMLFTANFVKKEAQNPDKPVNPENPDEPGSNIIFEDDFEQNSRIPDESKWMLSPKGTSNWNRYNSESYDQAYVENGKLVLMAEMIDGEYKTGAIRMLNDLGFKYALVEVNAKFSKMVRGGWPAIWLMPAQPLFSGWPNCGEIDMMEHLNLDNLFYSALHSKYIDTLGNKNNPLSSKTTNVNTSEFNTYGMEWNEEEILFYLNGEEIFSYPNLNLSDEETKIQWPFDTTFYLILNHALGGEGTWPGPINDSQLPGIFEIDWVKVTQINK